MMSKEHQGRQVSQGCVGHLGSLFSTGQGGLKEKNLETGRGKMVGTREFHQTENTNIDFPIVFL